MFLWIMINFYGFSDNISFFFQAEDGIRDYKVTGVQTCALPICHIVRGDDHLTNAARQTIIYKAMDWDVPEMAHIPQIGRASCRERV